MVYESDARHCEKNRQSKRLDGKEIRHSTAHPLRIVSAWCTNNRLVLGSKPVDEKSNEIKAIPCLLDLLNFQGQVITIDAIGTQKDICEKIMSGGGDYCISLKKNQKNLFDKVHELFSKNEEETFAVFEHHDKGHGRIESRKCRIFHEPGWMREWKGLRTVIELTRKRIVKGKESEDKQYYISSLECKAEEILDIIRGHWDIENWLHWVLDVTMNQDKSGIQIENSALNMDTIRKICINVLNYSKGKKKYLRSMQRSCWNPDNALKFLIKFYHS